MKTQLSVALIALLAVACAHEMKLVEPVNKADGTPQQSRKEADTQPTQKTVAGVCVDYSPQGYWENNVYNADTPLPEGYVAIPSGMTACDLEQLHIDCVDRINKYRSGELLFSDGTQDSNVMAGLDPLTHRTGTNICANEATVGDLLMNYANGGGCAGGHEHAFVCPWQTGVGQNSCCGSGDESWGSWDTTVYDTYEEVQTRMYGCLQQMWDEGITPGIKGHWENMRNPDFTNVACGFAFSEAGRVFMNQDFYESGATCTPSCTECGGDDGCSGNECYCEQTDDGSYVGMCGDGSFVRASVLANAGVEFGSVCQMTA